MLSSSGQFDVLPEEMTRHVYSFADIPSLSCLARTGKNLLARYASDDTTWGYLVERRFRLATSKTLPKFHGGRSWKEAYRTMARCNRVPKCRYTSARKVVFAKGQRTTAATAATAKQENVVSLWVLLGHTENCETRIARTPSSHTSVGERYIELLLCVQNVKSSFGTVRVDVTETVLQGLDHSGAINQRPVHVTGLRLHDGHDGDLQHGVYLSPFQLAVISVHVSCPSDVYETDFLSKALSMWVPVRPKTVSQEEEDSQAEEFVAIPDAAAFFISENDIWNCYTELPGGCMTLSDRFRLVTA